MHFTIPITEDLVDNLGSRYVLYTLFLDGFLFCKVRYSRLHQWNEQVRWYFRDNAPTFPPKIFLAMTDTMAEGRRLQLEHYLQNVCDDVLICRSEVFSHFFRGLQEETFLVPKKLVGFDVFLPDGEKVLVDMQSTDTAERLLQLVAHRIRLSRELSAYFALFVIHEYEDGSYSVLKKLAEFELPFVIPWSTGDKHSKIVIRKWYMDPGLDEMFFESSAGLYLLYAQAVHDLKEGRMKPTDEQLKQLKMLEEAENKKEYLKVMQQVEYYGCMQFDTCVYKNQMVDHPAVVRVGKDVINCNIRLPNNQLEEIDFTIRRMKCWRIRLMGEFLNGQNKDAVHNMEVSFEYCNANNSWTWITFYTDQAFLLSNCIQQMVAEHLPKNSIGNMEMLTETPESESMITQITRRLQFLQFEGSSTALGKFVSSFKVKREQNASEDVQDEDL